MCIVDVLCDEDVSEEDCYKFYKEANKDCEIGEKL